MPSNRARALAMSKKVISCSVDAHVSRSPNSSPANLPLAGVDGEILVVSQFTLYANLRKGRRPSWGDAEDPEIAAERVEALAEALESRGARVSRGVFGAVMDVELLNDGPFTLVLEGRSLSSM